MPTTPPQRPVHTASGCHSPQWLGPESRPPTPVTAPPFRTLWRRCGNLRRSARRAQHCSSYYTANSSYLLRTFPSAEPSNGMGTTLGSGFGLDLDKTLACRTFGTPPRHAWRTVPPTVTTTPPAGAARTPAQSPQDQGRLPCPAPYPTVYFPQCSTTAPPRFGGRRRLP